MTAAMHTQRMLAWWCARGVERIDVAVRRPGGTVCWQRCLAPRAVPLPWMRAENVREADVYVRPARGFPWPVLFLDDLAPLRATRVAARYDALVVRTSPAGGCHLWLHCSRALDESQRGKAQRWLAIRLGADPRSTSGEHLGRLAGFRNWKRRGSWIGVIPTPIQRPPWDPIAVGDTASDRGSDTRVEPAATVDTAGREAYTDRSESGKEWGWVCGAIEAGIPYDCILQGLIQRARPRKGCGAARYAQRTVDKAIGRRGATSW